MSYQVLAQKYRPQTFDDVIGQEAVTRTLKNSISQGRVANAYIFCGPRGVGKTSVARLLSKTLNCERAASKRPCNDCTSCREISQANSIDVLEIDGASNRGIDEIRTLRENVKFSPSKGKFKIYIIDEVHMLTQEAFNALLKTLEEPPEHVKFIFATTEPHKVLATIMSRCQRFDFKRIPPKMIFDRLVDIAEKEKINVDEKAALLISRSADGSLRDALVVLDQMVSFSGKKILPEEVVELLGMIHQDKMFELSGAIIGNDPKAVAVILDEMINNGKDPVFLVNSLIAHYRDLMVLKTVGSTTTDMAFTDEELAKLEQETAKLSLEEILYVLQNLSHCLTLMKGAVFARAPLEITLIRLTRRRYVLALPDILSRLEGMGEGGFFPAADAPSGKTASAGAMASADQNGYHVQSVRSSRDSRGKQDFLEEPDNADQPPGGFDSAKAHWKAVLNYVKGKKMSVFTFLSAGKPVEFSDKKVVIGFAKEHSFNKDALEAESNKSVIEEAVSKVTGNTPKLEFTLLEFLGKAPDEEPPAVPGKKTKVSENMKPVIEKTIDVFGGQVIRDYTEDNK